MADVQKVISSCLKKIFNHKQQNYFVMKKYNLFLGVVFSLFIYACGGSSEEHKILHEAADIHVEALQIKKEMEPDLQSLESTVNSIQVQGRELSSEEIKFIKEYEVLQSRLKYWNDNHIEVPGFEHEGHDHSGHDHNHDHSHAPKFQFPASDLLIIQKEFRDSINAIKGKMEVLLRNAPK